MNLHFVRFANAIVKYAVEKQNQGAYFLVFHIPVLFNIIKNPSVCSQ